MLQSNLPDDDLSELEDDTPQPIIDGSNDIECWINLDECEDPGVPQFSPLEEDDESNSQEEIETEQE